MPQKPYNIIDLKDNKSIGLLDGLLSLLFDNSQDKQHKYYEFTDTGVWIDASLVNEKEFVICNNTTDVETRLYTKIKGDLYYITFS